MSCVNPSQQRWALRFADGPVAGGFTTRHAGNLHFSAAEPCPVVAARRPVLQEFGGAGWPLVEAQQVHGDNVFVVTTDSLNEIHHDDGRFVAPGSDALITALPGVILSLCFADCLPVFLWLSNRHGVGLAHAGWRGSLANLAAQAVQQLCQLTNTAPHELQALLGPAICADCYVVGRDVAEPAAALPHAEGFLRCQDEQWHLDLKALNEHMLIAAGLRLENIAVSSLCTKCRLDLLFSYRAEGPGCGEMAAFIASR